MGYYYMYICCRMQISPLHNHLRTEPSLHMTTKVNGIETGNAPSPLQYLFPMDKFYILEIMPYHQ